MDGSAQQPGLVGVCDEGSWQVRVHILGTRGYPSSYGGFETLLRHLAPHLVRQGHRVTVFDRRHVEQRSGAEGSGPEPAMTTLADGSIDVAGVRVVRSRGLHGTSSSTLTHGLHSALITAAERPDVALIMNVANGFFLPALRARRVPTVLNVDGIEWERAKWSPAGKRAFLLGARASARWADTLIADSEAIGERWQREFRRSSVFIPYGGDDPAPQRPERLAELGLTPGGYVLIVARMVPENNVEAMIDGALPAGLPVVVVGSGGGSETELRVMARHDPPRVQTLGHVSDQELLATLWAGCAAYLHGHSVGGTNPALVQAMGLGAPVLAYDTVYNREVLRDPRQLVGLEPASIRARLHEVLTAPGLREELVAQQRRRVTETYNWAAVCTGYEQALLGAISSDVQVLR